MPEDRNRLDRIRDGHQAEEELFTDISFELHRHGEVLDEHTRILDEHTRILGEHSRILGEHSRILDQHTTILHVLREGMNQHTGMLEEILRRLPPAS